MQGIGKVIFVCVLTMLAPVRTEAVKNLKLASALSSTAQYILDSAGTTSSLAITSTTAGCIGIGTTSLGQKLNVYSSGANSYIRSDGDNARDVGLTIANAGTDKIYLYRPGTASGYENDFRIFMNGADRFAINNSNGNVGIGVTSTNAKLHVKGGNDYTLKLDNDGSQWTYAYVCNNGTAKMSFGWDQTNTLGYFGTGAANAKLCITSGNSVTAMTLDASGNVGVGTTDPGSYKLKVAGDISGSNIYATQFRVGTYGNAIRMQSGQGTAMIVNGIFTVDSTSHAAELTGQLIADSADFGKICINDWVLEAPDYVFDKDYKLPQLKSVDTYVKQHKHLPDVASASEMKKKGVDLGQMNMALLKKVEELTLYVIEQDKRISAQDKKICDLEARMR